MPIEPLSPELRNDVQAFFLATSSPAELSDACRYARSSSSAPVAERGAPFTGRTRTSPSCARA